MTETQIERLLANETWLRPLALRLVGDESGAEDVLQEAWIAALRRPPDPAREPGPWLARVVRNLAFLRARQERRRADRERRAARPEALTATPDAILSRADARRAVARAVLELPEPFRATVLLRYFAELTPAEISRRSGLPLDTVNSRLRRGLERLRRRLDRAHGGRIGLALGLIGAGGLDGACRAAPAFAHATAPAQAAAAPLAAPGLAIGGALVMKKVLVVSAVVGLAALGTGVGIGRATSPALTREEAMARFQLVDGGKADAAQARYQAILGELRRLQARRSAAALAAGKKAAAKMAEPAAGAAGSPAGEGAAGADVPLFGMDLLREMLKTGEFDVELLTPEGIEATLEKHGRSAQFLVAAALLTKDKDKAIAYLEEALEKEPGSPGAITALLNAHLQKGETGQSVRELVERLKTADPTNSLSHYYDALLDLKAGDAAGALRKMEEAAAKTHLLDYAAAPLSASEAFFRDAGSSESLAKVMAGMGARLDGLLMLRDLAQGASAEASRLLEQGAPAQAIPFASSSARLGNQMSASGRFLLHDLVGIKVENQALEQEHKALEAEGRGSEDRAREIELRLKSNQARLDHGIDVSRRFSTLLLDMSEGEIVEYFNRLISEGEMSVAADFLRRYPPK